MITMKFRINNIESGDQINCFLILYIHSFRGLIGFRRSQNIKSVQALGNLYFKCKFSYSIKIQL